jgi:hypothetical protein
VIRGFFYESTSTAMPIVVVGFVLPHRGMGYAPIPFVLDSGAASTALHPHDAFSILAFTRDEFAELPRIARARHPLIGITGPTAYYVVPARYISGRDDGSPYVIDADVHIAEPVPGNAAIPSVLGWDILRHFRITLDHRTGEVLLDEAPPPRQPR